MKIKATCIAIVTGLTVATAVVRVNGQEAADGDYEPLNAILEEAEREAAGTGGGEMRIWSDDFFFGKH